MYIFKKTSQVTQDLSSKDTPNRTSKVTSKATPKVTPEVIANGAHGCLVRPALDCDKDTVINAFSKKIERGNRSFVSKIFREKSSWDDEIVKALKITQIPDYDKYFIVPLTACEVDQSQINIWKKCPIMENGPPPKDNRLHQLVMKNGGISIQEYILKNKFSFREWTNILLQILKCIKVLAENGLAHLDLKAPNIVYDTTTKVVKLIDYGLTTSFDEIYESLYKIRYLYYPIEFIIYELCCEKEVDKCDDTDNIHLNFMIPLQDKRKKNNTYYDMYEKAGILYDIKNVIKAIPRDCEKFKSKEMLSKIDIYALGITCLFLYKNIKGRKPKRYGDLVLNMCKINCFERISIDDAINEVESFL